MISHFTHRANAQKGMTMIEILIALAISAILLTGVIQIFVSNKQTARVQEALSRVQENGRFTMHTLSSNLRMAGFAGCSSGNIPNNIVDLNADGIADPVTDFSTAGLAGYEYSDLPITLAAGASLTTADVVADTDIVVTLNAAADTTVSLTGNMGVLNANLQMTQTDLFSADDIIIISDCSATDIFAATNASSGAGKTTVAHSSTVNTGNFLSRLYQTDAQVMLMEKTAYFIGTNSFGEPTLKRWRLTGQNPVIEELVDGVENMQIVYGEDTDADQTADKYVDATGVGNFANVISLRVDTIMRTYNDNLAAETDATYNDKRLRRPFSSTITIRNRIF